MLSSNTVYLQDKTFTGRSIAFHPLKDALLVGGIADGEDGAVCWFMPKQQNNGPFTKLETYKTHPNLKIPENLYSDYLPGEPQLCLPLSAVSVVQFSPDGRFLLVLGPDTERDRLFIYKVADNFQLTIFKKIELEKTLLQEACWSPDSSFVAVGSADGTVAFVAVRSYYPAYQLDSDQIRASSKLSVVKAVSGPVLGLEWSRCGFLLAVISYGEVRVLVKQIQKSNVAFRKGQNMKCFEKTMLDNRQNLVLGERQNPIQSKQLEDEVHEMYAPDDQRIIGQFLPKGAEKFMIGQRSLRTLYSIALYRRQVAWSPDSSFLLASSGYLPVGSGKEGSSFQSYTFASYIYSKKGIQKGRTPPTVVLPGHRFPSTAVAFSPVLYQLDPRKPNLSDLKYRMLFAVAAGCDLMLYDTQTFEPLCYFEGESFQDDFIVSLAFAKSGKTLCAFGALSQYQFVKIGYQLFQAEVQLQIPQLIHLQSVARMKAEYALKYKHAKELLKEFNDGKRNKKPNIPVKPKTPLLDIPKHFIISPIQLFTVSDLYQFEIQQPPLLQFEAGELDFLEQVVETMKVKPEKPPSDSEESYVDPAEKKKRKQKKKDGDENGSQVSPAPQVEKVEATEVAVKTVDEDGWEEVDVKQ